MQVDDYEQKINYYWPNTCNTVWNNGIVWGNVCKLISQNHYMKLTIPNLVSILPIAKKQLSKGTNSIKNEEK